MWSLGWVLLFSVAVIFLGIVAFVCERSDGGRQKLQPSEKEKQFRREIGAIIDHHVETLARRRNQLIKVDHYGVIDTSGWEAELQYFIDKVLFPKMVEANVLSGLRPYINSTTISHVQKEFSPILHEILEEKTKPRAAALAADLSFPEDVTPHDFERWCAKILGACGWKAVATKASGDQGADVIAEKAGMRIVLQCKLYHGIVGNKAVQEAYAAQCHYAAKASAVVTNATFSPSARDLANTTGVFLLHYGDLTRLDSLLDDANADAPIETTARS